MKIKITAKQTGNIIIDGMVIKPGLVFEVKKDSTKRVTEYLKYENIKFEEVKPKPPAKAPAKAPAKK